jgi:hypothetical protein
MQNTTRTTYGFLYVGGYNEGIPSFNCHSFPLRSQHQGSFFWLQNTLSHWALNTRVLFSGCKIRWDWLWLVYKWREPPSLAKKRILMPKKEPCSTHVLSFPASTRNPSPHFFILTRSWYIFLYTLHHTKDVFEGALGLQFKSSSFFFSFFFLFFSIIASLDVFYCKLESGKRWTMVQASRGEACIQASFTSWNLV